MPKTTANHLLKKALQIGNEILWHSRRYDPESNTYYFRNRAYDPTMGRFLQTDPMGYKDSMNLYQGFNMNPINFNDPYGLEPVKKYAGVVADIVNVMNNSPSKLGLKKGQQAIKALLYLGQDEISWKSGFPKPVPATTPHFNYKKGRYIYTKKGGWIDMSHFLFYAGRAYIYKIEKETAKLIEKSNDFTLLPWYIRNSISSQANLNPGGEAMQEGFVQERMDSVIAPHSAYSYEDLPSDKFGVIFALNYFNPNSNLTLAEQISNFLNNVLGATVPTAAPNWNIMPNKDTKNPPTQTNKTTTPIYTSEDVKKLKLFLQWLDSLYK
ncbi:RHS repeat-associated core domain-containing protein [Acidobacteriota bacterium]